MNKARICLAFALVLALLPFNIKEYIWNSLGEEGQKKATVELKAYLSGLDVDEFELMSAVVEAESDRTTSLDGKKLIALTIFNRKESSDFPNSIYGVITQAGQFQVYYEGTYKCVGRTDTSDAAVIEASFWIKEEHPNVIYFNCIGFSSWAEPYEYVDGNYFSLGD